MKNITVSIDDETHRRARIRAEKLGTSLSAPEISPQHHRDPFDQLILAQALVEGATIITRDPVIPRYGEPCIDATL